MFLDFFTVSSSLHFYQTKFQGTGPGRGTTAHGTERGMAAHCCSVWICQGCVWLFCTTFPTNTPNNLHRTVYPQWSHRCCPQPANIRWTSLSCFIDGPTRPSLGLWNSNRCCRKQTPHPSGHPQELIQTVAAATHAHARNPSQETIPCYMTPHDYGAMAPTAGEHRHANRVG